MKVAFDKLHANFAFDFECAAAKDTAQNAANATPQTPAETLVFRGTLTPKSPTLALLKATLAGRAKHACDRCGEEIWLTLNEGLELLISRGENGAADYEFFGGEIDLNAVAASEVELFKSGYFYCARCEKNENFEFNL